MVQVESLQSVKNGKDVRCVSSHEKVLSKLNISPTFGFILTENTLESRSGCILLGWVFTLSCSSPPLSWASSSSCTAYSLWTPMCQGRKMCTLWIDSCILYQKCISLIMLLLLHMLTSVRRLVMTTWTSPCVHCVMEYATTGIWVLCVRWPELRICLTMELPSSLLYSCLCGVTMLSNTLSW